MQAAATRIFGLSQYYSEQLIFHTQERQMALRLGRRFADILGKGEIHCLRRLRKAFLTSLAGVNS